MESFSRRFSDNLRRARGQRSQAEFARFLGFDHQATYQRYETGRIPDADVLYQMAIRLGVTMEHLLTGEMTAEIATHDAMMLKETGETYAIQVKGGTDQIESQLAETSGSVRGARLAAKRVLIEHILRYAIELKKRYMEGAKPSAGEEGDPFSSMTREEAERFLDAIEDEADRRILERKLTERFGPTGPPKPRRRPAFSPPTKKSHD